MAERLFVNQTKEAGCTGSFTQVTQRKQLGFPFPTPKTFKLVSPLWDDDGLASTISYGTNLTR
jgi:hypothetical protein